MRLLRDLLASARMMLDAHVWRSPVWNPIAAEIAEQEQRQMFEVRGNKYRQAA